MSEFLFPIKTIAIANTPYQEKFGIPRQSGLVDVPAIIELKEPFNKAEAIAGLEFVSHIWLTFLFSQHLDVESSLTVRPPRLGGNKKIGVFASRSSFRPNAIGQSVVKLERVVINNNSVQLHVTGIDLVDGTPIIDIKPYLPYADIVPLAVNQLASEAPLLKLSVNWENQALAQLAALKHQESQKIQQWITEIIQLDPRPAYKTHEHMGEYGMAVFNLNIRWRIDGENKARVVEVDQTFVERSNVDLIKT